MMEQAHQNLQKSGSKPPKKIFQLNNFNTKLQNHIKSNENNSSRINNEMFDKAVKELLDICHEYDVELSSRAIKDDAKPTSNNDEHSAQHRKDPSTILCDTDKEKVESFKTTSHNLENIEKLQKKQSELQDQLDEVLKAAKALEIRHQRKIRSAQNNSKVSNDELVLDFEETDTLDEEDELFEFQKIENELRISELNRHLDNIQEELRLSLYKRLLINTTSNSKAKLNAVTNNNNQTHSSNERRSSYTYDTSPSSSSCSYDPTTSVSSSTTFLNAAFTHENIPKNIHPSHSGEHCDVDVDETDIDNAHDEAVDSLDQMGSVSASHEFSRYQPEEKLENQNIEKEAFTSSPSNQNSTVCHLLAGENSVLQTDQESVAPPRRSSPAEFLNIYSEMTSNNHRNSSANSDLERIEEDEEYNQDQCYDPNQFKTIHGENNQIKTYESCLQKNIENSVPINPDVSATETRNITYEQRLYQDYANKQNTSRQQYYQSQHLPHIYHEQPCTGSIGDNRLVTSNNRAINSHRKPTNRPLTLYLPKPNEEIDLVEHIQALGHDLNLIAGDLKLDTTSAQGYLWKCCSNNSKKWLKRYFHFDRSMKILSYYENEANLVKKNCSLKNRIPFEEINDVYVDHKLSGLGEKDRSSKRHYVFVLATTQRKYLLASSRAETMRAWIDILFTAAKANDYFEQANEQEEDQYYAQLGGLAVSGM